MDETAKRRRVDRFEVLPQDPDNPDLDAYWILDNDWQRFNMPQKAVTLHMQRVDADHVADTLNDAWARFLAHPY